MAGGRGNLGVRALVVEASGALGMCDDTGRSKARDRVRNASIASRTPRTSRRDRDRDEGTIRTHRGDASDRAASDALSRGDIKRGGPERFDLMGSIETRRGDVRVAARPNKRRSSLDGTNTARGAHLEGSVVVSGDERRGRSRDKRADAPVSQTTFSTTQR